MAPAAGAIAPPLAIVLPPPLVAVAPGAPLAGAVPLEAVVVVPFALVADAGSELLLPQPATNINDAAHAARNSCRMVLVFLSICGSNGSNLPKHRQKDDCLGAR